MPLLKKKRFLIDNIQSEHRAFLLEIKEQPQSLVSTKLFCFHARLQSCPARQHFKQFESDRSAKKTAAHEHVLPV